MGPEAPKAASADRTPRAVGWLVVRLLVAASVLGFTLSQLPLDDLRTSLAELDPVGFLVAVAILASGNVLGAIRWRFALKAFGAGDELPPLRELVRLYFVTAFFNIYLPGGLGGDVFRAGVTHRALHNPTAAWLSVLTERLLGLAALLTVAGVAAALTLPLEGSSAAGLLAIGGLLAAAGGLTPVLLRPLARRYGLGELAALPLLGTWAVSLVAHVWVACAGYALARSLAPELEIGQALVVVPLAQAAVFFPATVGGLGVREAAFVVLLTRLGLAEGPAAAMAFAYLGVTLVAAATGGVVHVAWPALPTAEHSDTGTRP